MSVLSDLDLEFQSPSSPVKKGDRSGSPPLTPESQAINRGASTSPTGQPPSKGQGGTADTFADEFDTFEQRRAKVEADLAAREHGQTEEADLSDEDAARAGKLMELLDKYEKAGVKTETLLAIQEQIELEEQRAAMAFISEHEDYLPSPKNEKAITALLEKAGVPLSKDTLDKAWQYLKEDPQYRGQIDVIVPRRGQTGISESDSAPEPIAPPMNEANLRARLQDSSISLEERRSLMLQLMAQQAESGR